MGGQTGCCRGYPLTEIIFTDCRWTGDGKYGVDLLDPNDQLFDSLMVAKFRYGMKVQADPIFVEWVRNFDEIISPVQEKANTILFSGTFVWPILFFTGLCYRDLYKS